MIATAIRQIFAAESAAEAHERLAGVAAALEQSAPKVACRLLEAEDELIAFMAFPAEEWSKLRSTNPLERLNREIGCRSDVVGIYRRSEVQALWGTRPAARLGPSRPLRCAPPCGARTRLASAGRPVGDQPFIGALSLLCEAALKDVGVLVPDGIWPRAALQARCPARSSSRRSLRRTMLGRWKA